MLRTLGLESLVNGAPDSPDIPPGAAWSEILNGALARGWPLHPGRAVVCIEELSVPARRILIVEDETMIAMLLEDFLEELGWEVVGWAHAPEGALAMARDGEIDAALLDVNLNGQDSFAVADMLSERHIPFVFATGYGTDGVADRFRDVPTLTKPFHRDELDRALHRAMTES